MSNALTAFKGGALSSVFAPAVGKVEDLGAGIGGGFGVVSIKGKEFAVRYGGDVQPIPDAHNPRVTAREIEAVIVLGSERVSKNYYAKSYAPGDDNPPDCYSVTGVAPEPDSPQRQNDTCLTCRHNKFGSRITDNGKKAKACQDNKRVAIVPLADMANEQFGGPMLLRIPPTSLQGLAQFASGLKVVGHHYFTVGVRIGFANTEYPQLTFTPIRALNDEEATQVLAWRNDERTNRIVNQKIDDEVAAAAPASVNTMLAPPSKVLQTAVAREAAQPPQQVQEAMAQAAEPAPKDPEPSQAAKAPPAPPPATAKPGPARARQNTVATPQQAAAAGAQVGELTHADVMSQLGNFMS